jgi:SAM-dependent methyltransferase
LNFDASPTLRFERLPLVGALYSKNGARFPSNVRIGDIAKGLPIGPQSCICVYCSHVLEHLSLADFKAALLNTHRILKPGGTFRLVVPDLEAAARSYVGNPADDAAATFLKQTCLGEETRPRGFRSFVVSWLGNSRHLWMWDYKSIKAELENAGFVQVRRAFFGDSSDPMFKKVEDESRWADDCLGVESKKGSA